MGKITVTLSPELESEVEAYLGFRRDGEELSRLVRDALRLYMAKERQELSVANPNRPLRHLRLTPVTEGSGQSDVSANHDRYLAEDLLKERTKE